MSSQLRSLSIACSTGFADYTLLDCGAGRKLEKFGQVVVDRPEAQALWRPRLAKAEWEGAHAVFSASGEDDEKGKWRIDKSVPDQWPVMVDGVTMLCKLSGLWHLGLFPEQRPHWQWMLGDLGKVKREAPRVLNLFGYTGCGSLLAAKAGAEVTHVDASKKAIAWGRENQVASRLDSAKIRWILDDAAKFTAREVRRGRTYHMILIDPPKFGRGPDGEVWDLFTHLPALIADCARLLAPGHAGIVLTVYAIRASAIAFDQLLRDALAEKGGGFDSGELAIRARSGPMVPTSLFVRWTSAP